jgi:hypothetical protein
LVKILLTWDLIFAIFVFRFGDTQPL